MIFISHSAEDEGRLGDLVKALRALGVEVWFAPDDIRPGQSIPEEMARALGRATHLLVAWSRHSAASNHVKTEYRSFYHAHTEPGPILFMPLDGTPVDRLFGDRLYFRATGDAARDASFIADWAAGRTIPQIVHGGDARADVWHPLHDFPRGPMVELHRVTGALVRAYASLLDTRAAAHTLVQEANRLRLEADSGDPSVTFIGLEYLPAFEAGAYSFWQSAFYEACRHGPRMLAALLLAQPHEQLTHDARRDRAGLLDHLRAKSAHE
jgi:hypothetical protein